ncbi:PadR family transcriptional regulator [Actinacidiphila glaucinigra]
MDVPGALRGRSVSGGQHGTTTLESRTGSSSTFDGRPGCGSSSGVRCGLAEEEIHGAMTEELARHGYAIGPGTLYPTLHRLETDGLLVSEQRLVGGQVRRVYRATEAGKQALAEDRNALNFTTPRRSSQGGNDACHEVGCLLSSGRASRLPAPGSRLP